VQQGKHDELLQQGGLYREIYDLQLKDRARFTEEMQELQPVRVDRPKASSNDLDNPR